MTTRFIASRRPGPITSRGRKRGVTTCCSTSAGKTYQSATKPALTKASSRTKVTRRRCIAFNAQECLAFRTKTRNQDAPMLIGIQWAHPKAQVRLAFLVCCNNTVSCVAAEVQPVKHLREDLSRLIPIEGRTIVAAAIAESLRSFEAADVELV